ncbi:cysteine desulfurase family protein [Prochlorococcus marinus]|uniref:cysteine desulfurase n=1 Tax=Prochlorococcus marinus XMU1408 TaxID=2213228 RepID=A0A318R5P6_PROMR|nr:aminotransferase class V-fold PLP-dependent enzyme [Prochlorococcus marinus]MBW3041952.1 aminotransferase V [Prochlorococcus marinus str. XMU1408]PYE03078.1 aminotransferase V [Prochlorococcus marinus XMU1408]
MNNIYLDASATTPPHIDVINKIKDIQFECWGNPSSIHKVGVIAREILERSRLSIANKLKASSDDIFFTSGATESNYLSLKVVSNNLDKGRLVISSVEHPSINLIANQLLNDGWDIKYWPVDRYGIIDLDLLEEMLSPPTKLVSIIWGQSEIGSIQPINLIGLECKKRNILFHTDATQVLPSGLIDWSDLNVDMLSASAHKLQGPKGIGLLMLRKGVRDLLIKNPSYGFKNGSIRSGTESVPLIAGFSTAIDLLNEYIEVNANQTLFPENNVSKMTSLLKRNLVKNKQLTFIGPHKQRLPNNLSFLCHTRSMVPINGREIVRLLSQHGVYISSGSACSSSIQAPNPILVAINVDKPLQQCGLRITIGPWISNDDISSVSNIIYESLQSIELEKQ